MRSQAIARSQPQPRRARGREKTAKDLTQALERLQARSARVSIAAVAREAGVSAPLIHNKYPDFAEQIRGLVGKTTRQGQQTRLREILTAERKKSSDLRRTIKDLTLEIVALAVKS